MRNKGLMSWRNVVAHRVCNFILNHVATKEYRNAIGGLVLMGRREAVRRAEMVRHSTQIWKNQ